MKSFIILLSCLLFISSIIFAQNTKSCYTELRKEGLRYVSRKDYPKAVNSFFAARYCLDKPAKDDLDELIKNTQHEWVKALNDALAKSDSLIAYFGFAQDRAWAYKAGKFAVIDRNGKRLTDFEFENPEPFKQSGYAIAQKEDGFYYLIDKTGKVSEPYNYFMPCNNGWYKVKKGNLYTFYDKNYKQVEGWDWYDNIYDFREGIAMIQQHKKWGIIKLDGSYLITPQFDGPFFFSEGLAAVLKDKKWCYIDTTGHIVLTTEYDLLTNFQNGISFVKKNALWGIIDKTGKVIVPTQYERITGFVNNIASVANNNNWGYIRKDGTLLLPLQFEDAREFYNGTALVKKNNKWGLINENGAFAVEPDFLEVEEIYKNENIIKIKKDFTWGLMDRMGKMIAIPQYDQINFNEGENGMRVTKKDKRGFIDLKGNIIVELKFEEFRFSGIDSLIIVREYDKYGVFDITKDSFLLQPQFRSIDRFNEGFALVKTDSTYGFIDSNGKFLASNDPEFSSTFLNGNKWDHKNGKWGFLDANGNKLLDYQFDEPGIFFKGIALVRRSGKWGMINKNGKIIFDPQFDEFGYEHNRFLNIIEFKDGITTAKKNNKWGIISENGVFLITPQFDLIHDIKKDSVYARLHGETFPANYKGEFIIDETLEQKTKR